MKQIHKVLFALFLISQTGTTIASAQNDNWGTQVIITDLTLTGDGTATSPLGLARQSAEYGKVLKWNGQRWFPGMDDTGTSGLLLPYTGAWNQTNGIAFNIKNQGTAIEGESNSTSGVFYGLSGKSASADGIGVFGRSPALSGNTYGVYGLAISPNGVGVCGAGNSIGVFGRSDMQTGLSIGVMATSTSTDGIGALGIGHAIGIKGQGNTGILGVASNLNGFAGVFEGRLSVTGEANLNNGVHEGIALRCNGVEALWFDGNVFSWGFGSQLNYFAKPITIGSGNYTGYQLAVNGEAAKTGGSSWSVLSDVRLKNLTGAYVKGLNEIVALQPVTFTYTKDNPRELDPDKEQIGFIAQDVQKIFPEAINECPDGYLDFNMHAINVALVNAIKELKSENDQLKNNNDKLKTESEKFKAENELLKSIINLIDTRLSIVEKEIEASRVK
jgi:hypothetical protein